MRETAAVLLAVFFFNVGVVDEVQTVFVLLFCFSSPCQRPLSTAHPAWPQPVPTVYCGCHQAHGGPNKGGSVSIVLPRIARLFLAQTELRARGCQRSTREFDLTAMVRWQNCE